MIAEKPDHFATPCLCNALRRASRAVSRLYDEELRGVGLRTTQYSLLSLLHRPGEVRQGDLGPLTVLDETSLTRTLRPLVKRGWVAVVRGKTGRTTRFDHRGRDGQARQGAPGVAGAHENGSGLRCQGVSGRTS